MTGKLSALMLFILVAVIACTLLVGIGVATAHSDMSFSRRGAEYLTSMQECTNLAQDWLAEVCTPENEGRQFEKVFTDGDGHFLEVELLVENGCATVLRWQARTEWTQELPLRKLAVIG